MSLIASLGEAGWFEAYSTSSDPKAFIESRRRLYQDIRDEYSMYFGAKSITGSELSLVGSNINTTASLKDSLREILDRSSGQHMGFYDFVEPHVRDHVKRMIDPDLSSGLTPRLVLGMEGQEDALRRLGKELIAAYGGIYRGLVGGWTITNLGYFRDFENDSSFPFLDWRILSALAPKLGLRGRYRDNTWTADTLYSIDGKARAAFQYAYRKFCRVAQQVFNVRSVMEAGRIGSWIQGLQFEVRELSSELDFPGLTANLVALVTTARRSLKLFEYTWDSETTDLMTTLLMTATDVEDEVVSRRLRQEAGPPLFRQVGQQTCAVYESASLGVVIHARSAAGTIGTMGALTTLMDVLNLAHPQRVVSVGICFGLKQESQKLGDVAVSESVFEYERQRVTGGRSKKVKLEPRGDKIPADVQLVTKARMLKVSGLTYGVHVGPFSSGDKLIDSFIFREQLKSFNPQAVAGEMEGAGVAAACQRNHVPFVVVKGICDWAYKKEGNYQSMAAANAMDLAIRLLLQ
jgi:nucleoside phosphorylase